MRPPNLSGTQHLFQDYLLHGANGAETLVLEDARGDAIERLGVYANAYRLRLLEVLGNDYPALKAYAGEERFERFGRDYLAAHPSDTPSVRWFGRHLPAFLKQGEWAADGMLADLAAFEWAKGEVFDAPENESLEIAAVAAVPPESWPQMRLLLHPALRRLRLRANAPELFLAHEAGEALPEARAEEPRGWLLWRDAALDISWRSLEADEEAALQAVADGRSFGDICELLCEWVEPEEAAMHAAGLLKRWVFDGLIVEIEGI